MINDIYDAMRVSEQIQRTLYTIQNSLDCAKKAILEAYQIGYEDGQKSEVAALLKETIKDMADKE